MYIIGRRPIRFVRGLEPSRSFDDPSKGAGDRRGSLGRTASTPARLSGHLGNRRWRPEGQLVHGHYVRHAVPVAGYSLSHSGQ